MYWKDRFNGRLPQPQTANPPPQGYVDMITDNDDNYINNVLPNPTPTCPPASNRPTVDQTYAEQKIDTYCKLTASTNWIVNSTTGRYGPAGYTAGTNAAASKNQLWLSVSFDPLCDPKVSYTVTESECGKNFSIALNGCNTGSGAKWGGEVQSNCAVWNITTRAGTDQTPPNGYPPIPRGK